MPPVGYRTYSSSPTKRRASRPPDGVQVGETAYENAFYRVALAPGGIRSLFDKELGKEVLRTEKLLGAEVVMLEFGRQRRGRVRLGAAALHRRRLRARQQLPAPLGNR